VGPPYILSAEGEETRFKKKAARPKIESQLARERQ